MISGFRMVVLVCYFHIFFILYALCIMKFYLRLLVAWVSLFILWSVALVHSMTVEDFNDKWDNGPISACYSGNKVVACSCTWEDALRWCVRDSKQSTWSFSNPWDVEIRKLVLPTAVPWVFDVNVLLRWKRVPQIRDDLNVCSVVVGGDHLVPSGPQQLYKGHQAGISAWWKAV